jgi:hypothetical protein
MQLRTLCLGVQMKFWQNTAKVKGNPPPRFSRSLDEKRPRPPR